MRQITIRQLVRQPGSLVDWLPCEVTKDGEVIALMLPPSVSHDVRQTTRTDTKSDKLTELPLSKKKQAAGFLSS